MGRPSARDRLPVRFVPEECTHDAAAQAIAKRFAGRIFRVPEWDCWAAFEGGRWKLGPEAESFVMEAIRTDARDRADALRALHHEAKACRLGNASWAKGVLTLLRAELNVLKPASAFDADGQLIGLPDGVLRFEGGKATLRPAQPEDMVTKSTRARPQQGGARWQRFLADITEGNKEKEGFLQRFFGSALIGGARDHAALFILGAGGNGKTVLLEALRHVLGSYAATTPMRALLAAGQDDHPAALARLTGKRLVLASEIEGTQRLAAARFKALTGGDTITARQMYGEFEEFTPNFRLVIAANELPHIAPLDDAILRRVVVWRIGFKPTRPDLDLPEALRSEAGAIMAWLVAGAEAWLQRGLDVPIELRLSTEEALLGTTPLQRWMQSGQVVFDTDASASAKGLKAAFEKWLAGMGAVSVAPLSDKAFGAGLRGATERMGRRLAPGQDQQGRRVYRGISLCPDIMDE